MSSDFKSDTSLEVVNASVDQQINNLTNNIDAIINGANSGAALIASTILTLKEFESTMKQMEYTYGIIMKNMDKNIRQIESGGATCEAINKRIDKLYDKVLTIDIRSTDESIINFRAELLRGINIQMDALIRIQASIFNC